MVGRNRTNPFGALAIAAALAAAPAIAQQAEESADELAAQATDPTAQLMSFQLNNAYVADYHELDDTSNQLIFRAAIPFALGSTKHIFRVTQPYQTSGPRGGGWVDTTLFDLMVFDQPWGRWGAGVSGTAPTGSSELTTDKWTAGPALGFVNSSTQGINWGLFLQSFFSFAGTDGAPDVGLVNFQPILSYQLGRGRSLSLGNSALVYDLERDRWTSLFTSINYGQVVSLWGHKWRPNAEIGYEFEDDVGNPEWVVRVGVTLLLPR